MSWVENVSIGSKREGITGSGKGVPHMMQRNVACRLPQDTIHARGGAEGGLGSECEDPPSISGSSLNSGNWLLG